MDLGVTDTPGAGGVLPILELAQRGGWGVDFNQGGPTGGLARARPHHRVGISNDSGTHLSAYARQLPR